MNSNEIAVQSMEEASKIAEVLLENNYAVMLTREEHLYIINYTWVEGCNRNAMVFITQEEYELAIQAERKYVDEYIKKMIEE